jgi:hypothetical protein
LATLLAVVIKRDQSTGGQAAGPMASRPDRTTNI